MLAFLSFSPLLISPNKADLPDEAGGGGAIAGGGGGAIAGGGGGAKPGGGGGGGGGGAKPGGGGGAKLEVDGPAAGGGTEEVDWSCLVEGELISDAVDILLSNLLFLE